MHYRSTIAIIAAILCSFAQANAQSQATSGAQSQTASGEAATLTVQTYKPEMQNWTETVPATGWLEAWQEAIVSAEISGQRLVAVNVDVGSSVRKGEVLAELSSETIKNEILQRNANVLTAQAALEQASASAERSKKLSISGTVSQENLTEAIVSEKKAQAELASVEAALASTKLNLDQTKIVAVDDGVISSRSAALGNVVAAGSELFRFIRQGRIEWRAEVPLKRMLKLREGTKAVLPTPIGDVHGRVRLISPTTSDKNGRLTVFVEIDPPENAPPPTTGILVSGYFVIGERPALTVPSSAITIRDGLSYVFVINRAEPTTVSRKLVSTGRRQDGQVEIVNGISASEEIVLSGGAFLADGSVVRIVDNAGKVGDSQ